MKAVIFTATVFLSATCSSAPLKVGETQPLTENGQQVGTVKGLSGGEQEFTYSKPSSATSWRWIETKGQFKTFERFDAQTGRLQSRSHYFQGKLNRVEIMNPDGSVRGTVSYPDGKTARTVELPKNGKVVEFIAR